MDYHAYRVGNQSWTAFCYPLPTQLGVCGWKKWCNPIGCGPGSGVNKWGGVERALFTMDHVCRQLTGQKLCAGQHHAMICEDLGVRKCLVLKIKKLLDDGWQLMS
jgi:hypothetical protein